MAHAEPGGGRSPASSQAPQGRPALQGRGATRPCGEGTGGEAAAHHPTASTPGPLEVGFSSLCHKVILSPPPPGTYTQTPRLETVT